MSKWKVAGLLRSVIFLANAIVEGWDNIKESVRLLFVLLLHLALPISSPRADGAHGRY
jgi:hypothetical protein